jgi:hypothetical protein
MKSKKWALLILVFTVFMLTEGLCYLSLFLLDKVFDVQYDPNVSNLSEEQKARLRKFLNQKTGERVGQDPVLGWINTGEINSAGMRDNREYDKVPTAGTIRISAFGDSFTYGADVKLSDTWEKQLSLLDPSIEVLNYGGGAYGLDQAYLLYLRLGTEYSPNIVFIGYMSENIARNVNVFRAFYTRWYRNVIFTKPRFKVRDGELILIENPLATFEDYEHFLFNDREVLARLGKNDYHYQTNYHRGTFDFLRSVRFVKIFWCYLVKKVLNPIFNIDGMYNENSEAYVVTLKIFDAFYLKALENGALPVILIFPDINDQWRSRDKKIRRYTPLINYFRSKGYRFIDTLDALEPYESSYTVDELVENWGHYSPLGNRIIAAYIYSHLKNWGLLNLAKLKEEIKIERGRLDLAVH